MRSFRRETAYRENQPGRNAKGPGIAGRRFREQKRIALSIFGTVERYIKKSPTEFGDFLEEFVEFL